MIRGVPSWQDWTLPLPREDSTHFLFFKFVLTSLKQTPVSGRTVNPKLMRCLCCGCWSTLRYCCITSEGWSICPGPSKMTWDESLMSCWLGWVGFLCTADNACSKSLDKSMSTTDSILHHSTIPFLHMIQFQVCCKPRVKTHNSPEVLKDLAFVFLSKGIGITSELFENWDLDVSYGQIYKLGTSPEMCVFLFQQRAQWGIKPPQVETPQDQENTPREDAWRASLGPQVASAKTKTFKPLSFSG